MTTYLEFIEKVETYIRMPDNDSIRPQLKVLINDSITEFCRFREWLRLQTVFEFTSGKSFAIVAADHVTDNSIEIAGNYVFKFKTGDTVTISGSTANDGDYTIDSTPVYDSGTDQTEIIFTEALTDSTADGTADSAHEDYGCPADFINEIGLYDSAGNRVEKVSYKEYLQSSTSVWANFGNRIYIAGEDADYKLLYTSKGNTLTDDDDTSNVLDHYEDIIKQWVIYKFYLWYGADESAAREEMLLKNDINSLKMNESRMEKNGRHFRISVHNR